MKRILISVITIATVATLGYLTTGAFFSDEETSSNNTFTAGAVDLKVDSECHYYHLTGLTYESHDNLTVPRPAYTDVGCNGFGTWASTDLTQEKFFNFNDVKPGDLGENTLSLTVVDNNAWACMYVENIVDSENIRIEPEIEAGDTTDDSGELAQNLRFSAWLDQGQQSGFQGKYVNEGTGDKGEGDNIWQKGEPVLFNNQPLSNAGTVLKIADSTTGTGPLLGGLTSYYGLAWCAGNIVMDQAGMGNIIYCDGEPLGNQAQTDSLSADVRIYVEQARNNPNFVCPTKTVVTYPDQAYNSEFACTQFDEKVWDLTKGDVTLKYQVDLSDVNQTTAYETPYVEVGMSTVGSACFNPGPENTYQGGAGGWMASLVGDLATDPVLLDLDDKHNMSASEGRGEGDYDAETPDTIVAPFGSAANHGIWFDRDGVDEFQANLWGAIDGGTYNTNGIYDIEITYHAVSLNLGTMFATVNGVPTGFYIGGYKDAQPEKYPAGLSFKGDMTKMQVFSGIWYTPGASGPVTVTGLNASQ